MKGHIWRNENSVPWESSTFGNLAGLKMRRIAEISKYCTELCSLKYFKRKNIKMAILKQLILVTLKKIHYLIFIKL